MAEADDIRELAQVMEAIDLHNRRHLIDALYRGEDRYEGIGKDGRRVVFHARSKYAKHLQFFEAGAHYRERCFMAANRVGKTFGAGGYESTLHLIGKYPHWWVGRRFRGPVDWWAAGKTNETTRDIVQKCLLGEVETVDGRKRFDGTGVIPFEHIGSVTWKSGVTDLADMVKIRHRTGRWSTLGLKSYQQGRGSFEGTAKDGIWLDEEPPQDVYGECLIRTATTNGIVMLTFTPLEGMSEVVMSFMPSDMVPQDGSAGL